MGYTPDATMEPQSLRDVERWKDKIEVRLDHRQVFFLFFGSALVACLLFILGVIVGKRLESRGRATAPEIEDPLALLDKLATSPVVAPPQPQSPRPTVVARAVAVAKTAMAPTVPVTAKAPEPTPAAPLVAKEAQPPMPAVPVVAPEAVVAKPAGAAQPPAAAAVAAADGTAAKKGGRFTLQIRSFQDRAEAESFAKQFAPDSPQILSSELPGKGLWHRIRAGDFRSYKEAVDAKLAFEKKYNVIALVVGPL